LGKIDAAAGTKGCRARIHQAEPGALWPFARRPIAHALLSRKPARCAKSADKNAQPRTIGRVLVADRALAKRNLALPPQEIATLARQLLDHIKHQAREIELKDVKVPIPAWHRPPESGNRCTLA
jgi:hypothetical protein